MARFAIYPYGPSNSVNLIKDAINARFDSNPARKLLTNGNSNFRGRDGDLIVNWGNSTPEQDLEALAANGTLLNKPAAIRNATMKTECLDTLIEAGVPCVERTTNRGTAQEWVNNGDGCFSRTVLQGHSGEGIVYSQQSAVEDLGNVDFNETVPEARLYTKAIVGPRREFRIHVMAGKVIYVQLKRRRNNYRDNPDYSNVVRNHGNGWIYALSNVTPNSASLHAAVNAVEALGLDFGAVDVITNSDNAWVLEVNTAPGQDGETTRERYVDNFISIMNGEGAIENLPEGAMPEAPASAPVAPVVPASAVRTWGCFDNISALLGDELAERELALVEAHLAENPGIVESNTRSGYRVTNATVGAAFSWERTPQGHIFWDQIAMNLIPSSIRSEVPVTPGLFRIYPVLSSIIGEEAAITALEAVIASGMDFDPTASDYRRTFNFVDTPQGATFWNAVRLGVDLAAPVSDMACFAQVRDVIGEAAAITELEAARDGCIARGSRWRVTSTNVNDAFTWSSTPQGDSFWNPLHRGDVPTRGYSTGSVPESVATAIAERVAREEARRAEVAAARSARSGAGDLNDNSFYAIRMAGELTVGKFFGGEFHVCGIDVPIAAADVTVEQRLDF